MRNGCIKLYVNAGSAFTRLKDFAKGEVSSLRSDERGLEVLQVVLIIVMVVVIAAVLWAFLGEWVTNLLQDIADYGSDFGDVTVTNPGAP